VAEPERPDDPRGGLVRRVRAQAVACRELGSPLYASLLDKVADDVRADGPSTEVLAGSEHVRRSALALRLMGAVHRLVLERRAPGLAMFYPSVGGTADLLGAWPAFRDVVVEHRDELRRLLDRPPQTNEVGRAACLIGGLLHVVDRWPGPLRLFEIGASAGLNLRADRFRVELVDGGGVGPYDSPVVLADPWLGRRPPLAGPLHIVERRGCDTDPVDPTTSEGRLLLTSFVWPDQPDRLERLRGAFQIASQVPATVLRRSARDFVADLRLAPGTTTVLWHSIMWQYLDDLERSDIVARLDSLGETADPDARLAHLSLEPRRRTPASNHEVLVVLRMWPGGEERVLGAALAHGIPTTWD
jgi:hypothetical protein